LRFAVISDIHGNKNALDAVLDDLHHQKIDRIICAGDFIDPLPESKVVFDQLRTLKIPMIRGNHEDYIIKVHDREPSPYITDENWAPVRATAKLFNESDVQELKSLPLQIYLRDENALVCHAGPNSNLKGWKYGFDKDIETQLERTPANLVVCGHWHILREENWRNKKLVIVGSVGVPLHGAPLAEYTILRKQDGEWSVENRFVPYDNLATAKKYVESGMVSEAAPFSWLLLDEIITGGRRISPFIDWKNSSEEMRSMPWREATKKFFEKIGRWEEIKSAARI
jgi:putative phosphoesterase